MLNITETWSYMFPPRFRNTETCDFVLCSIIYFLSEIGVSFLITLYTISYHHLLLIAWERYVAIVKWTEYKVLVTQGRLKKYTVIAWMDSVTKVALWQALVFTEVSQKVLFAVDLVINLGRLTETLTVVYFYRMLWGTKTKQISNQPIECSTLATLRFCCSLHFIKL